MDLVGVAIITPRLNTRGLEEIILPYVQKVTLVDVGGLSPIRFYSSPPSSYLLKHANLVSE